MQHPTCCVCACPDIQQKCVCVYYNKYGTVLLATSWVGAGLSPWDLIRHTHHVYVKERSNILSLFHLSQHISYSKKKNVLFSFCFWESCRIWKQREKKRNKQVRVSGLCSPFVLCVITHIGKRKEENWFWFGSQGFCTVRAPSAVVHRPIVHGHRAAVIIMADDRDKARENHLIMQSGTQL